MKPNEAHITTVYGQDGDPLASINLSYFLFAQSSQSGKYVTLTFVGGATMEVDAQTAELLFSCIDDAYTYLFSGNPDRNDTER